MRSTRLVQVGVVMVAFGIAMMPYLSVGFILDDYFYVDHLAHAAGLAKLEFAIRSAEYEMHLWPRLEPVEIAYLRPLSMASLWLDWQIWGLRPVGYHLTNLVLHCANVALLFGLARALRLGVRPAAAAAVVWGLAVQTAPAVGWISGRTELLAACGTLGGGLALLTWLRDGRRRWLLLAAGAALLAALAKESGVVAPALMLLLVPLARLAGATAHRLHRGVVLTLLTPVVLVLVARVTLFATPPPPAPYWDLEVSLGGAVAAVTKTLFYFTSATLSLPVFPLTTFDFLRDHPLLAAGLLIAAVTLWISAARLTHPRVPPVLLAWFLVALLPYAPVMGAMLYLYLPLTGIALLIGYAMHAAGRPIVTAWAVGLSVVGWSGHLALGGIARSVTHAVEDAVDVIGAAVEAHDPGAVLLIDAPLWTYGLPAALRVRGPDRRVAVHFLSFAPGILPHSPSQLDWTSRERIVIDAEDGAFFDSAVERFLLFGADPERPAGPRGPIDAYRAERGPRGVDRLVFDFRSGAVPENAVVVRFCGWRAVLVTRDKRRCSDVVAVVSR